MSNNFERAINLLDAAVKSGEIDNYSMAVECNDSAGNISSFSDFENEIELLSRIISIVCSKAVESVTKKYVN